MKKFLAPVLLSFAFACLFSSATFAQSTTTIATTTPAPTSSGTTDLLAEIQKLLTLITSLQTQLNELKAEQTKVTQELGASSTTVTPLTVSEGTESVAPPSTPPLPIVTFTRTLGRGVTGNDVRELQLFLKSLPGIYPEGLLTNFYGPLTEKAVQRFQAEYGIVDSGTPGTTGFGAVGSKTQAKIRELMTQGAGNSGNIPQGLLTAPGIQKKLEAGVPTTPTITPSGTIPAQPVGQTGTTTIPAIPAHKDTLPTAAGITILSPNGGEQWIKGNTYQITWHNPVAPGFPGDRNFSWKVTVEGPDGRFWHVGNFPVSVTSATWVIPLSLPDSGTAYKARVMLERACTSVPCPSHADVLHNTPLEDTSDNTFSIYALAVAPAPAPAPTPSTVPSVGTSTTTTTTQTATTATTTTQTATIIPPPASTTPPPVTLTGAPALQWIRAGSDGDVSSGIALDSNASVYLVGGGYGSLIKYTSEGNKLWIQRTETINRDEFQRVTVDQWGNIYVVGATRRLNGDYNEKDGLLAKYDAQGNQLWVKVLTASGFQDLNEVAVGPDGNIYVVGSSNRSIDGETNVGSYDVLVSKYDTGGNKIWTRLFGSVAVDIGEAIAIDGDGNIYISGRVGGSIDGQVHGGGDDAFVAKYNSSGTRVWIRLLGSVGWDDGQAVAIDGVGNVYIAGNTLSSLVDGQSNGGATDGFVAKYDANGNKIWIRQQSNSGSFDVTRIAIQGSTIYMNGYGVFASTPFYNTFYIAQYDTNGILGPMELMPGGSALISGDLAANGSGVVYTTGQFANTGNSFIAKYLFTPMMASSPSPAPLPTPAPSPTPPPSSTTATDTTAPSVPTNLTATASATSSQVFLAWTPSTDTVGVTGYKIYRNGVLVTNAALYGIYGTLAYTDSVLTAGTTYSYTLAAYDAAGNVSAQTSSVSATTLAALTISQVQGLTATVSGISVALSWQAGTASAGIGSYTIYQDTSADFTPRSTYPTNRIADGVKVLSFITVGLPPGTYYFKVVLQDVNGTVGPASSAVSVIIPTFPDLVITNLVANLSLIPAGSSTPITASVRNIGTGAAGASMVSFIEMGMTLYELPVPALKAWEAIAITQSMGTAPNIAAKYRWSAKVDSTNVVSEINEVNNVSSEVLVDTYVSTTAATAYHSNLAATLAALTELVQKLQELLKRLR